MYLALRSGGGRGLDDGGRVVGKRSAHAPSREIGCGQQEWGVASVGSFWWGLYRGCGLSRCSLELYNWREAEEAEGVAGLVQLLQVGDCGEWWDCGLSNGGRCGWEAAAVGLLEHHLEQVFQVFQVFQVVVHWMSRVLRACWSEPCSG